MSVELNERLAKLEVLMAERQTSTEAQLLELKQAAKEIEVDFYSMLKNHTEEEMLVMTKILGKLEGIETQTANFKGVLGGILIAASSVWFVLSQVASWLHLDFIKILGSSLGK